ncbi:hypothetical protein DFH08DRAFT_820091 [Mycena albidolilacea]|uniref:Uncharacterized protein n=1 Tax=Mycena albidolilacea TaxID=1033008 RepID=A0AAD6ZCV6_9AGAR|nr:hypothetical protein DFH08DRAFT_820091 [Mycena albidolilacea]
MSKNSCSQSTTLLTELLELTQQLTPPVEAPDDVENPSTLEDCVHATGRHFIIEYGLFLLTDIHILLATEEDSNFSKDTEFESEKFHIQGQLRDVIAQLPLDARAICDQEWISSAVHLHALFSLPGFKGVSFSFLSPAHRQKDRLRRWNGCIAATADAAAFYSMLKAEVLFTDYDGTMDVNKIFRGPLLLIIRFFDLYASIYASIIWGPLGAKELVNGTSKLPVAKVSQRIYRITCSTPAAIAASSTWAIWLLSSDTQLSSDADLRGFAQRSQLGPRPVPLLG